MGKTGFHLEIENKIKDAIDSGMRRLNLSVYSSEKENVNRLTELPSLINEFKDLEHLNLYGNNLTELPNWIGNLKKLKTLNLAAQYSSSPSGLKKLPREMMYLTQLEELILTNHQLEELPECLKYFPSLEKLDISRTSIADLPDWIGNLKKLRYLDIGGHWNEKTPRIETLPKTLLKLQQLEVLNISHLSKVSSLPYIGNLKQLRELHISSCKLNELPIWLQNLSHLENLNVSSNTITDFPFWIDTLSNLKNIDSHSNLLRKLPKNFSQLKKLEYFSISENRFNVFPDEICDLYNLKELYLIGNNIGTIPESIHKLRNLQLLIFGGIKLSHRVRYGKDAKPRGNLIIDIPNSILKLEHLKSIELDGNPLNLELEAAYNEGFEAIKRYLKAKTDAQESLYEAKLILIGEGEVGKSCLLSALRGETWVENRPTTHGIEIKPIKIAHPSENIMITLNGWDFGGQRVYRPTHQLFFSSPAVYLVVWKPREGSQAGAVKEWIKLVKFREPDAKIIVVATHGGPKERQPDIDRQEIWDLFGKETIIEFLFVDSKPKEKTFERKGISKLKQTIALVAAGLPEMGRKIPKRWSDLRNALRENNSTYLSYDNIINLCNRYYILQDEAKDFIRISHRLGHLIHYEHDPILQNIIILKPDWLSVAISYVLDDERTREAHGLVEFSWLNKLWNDTSRPKESRYETNLHPLFLRLMERFDLSYKVAVPFEPENAISFWHRFKNFFDPRQKDTIDTKIQYTSLIAQLVPDVRPDTIPSWLPVVSQGDIEQVQICRIVDSKNGQSSTAEGLFYQLIVRLHKYSLGRIDYKNSVHWQRGLVLDDDYNGRAFLKYIGNDVRITVRAPYPERFLSVLTGEVKWLVENFWAGLKCEIMVPCIEPCGKGVPGTGLFDVQKLIESKKRQRLEYPCPVCNEWQNIDCLLRNASVVRRTSMEELLLEFASMKDELVLVRNQLINMQDESIGRFEKLDLSSQLILSKVDDAYTRLMQTLQDEAKNGPRLFSFMPVERTNLNLKEWITKKFVLTLWCEHSRLPLPVLNNNKTGTYEITLKREWITKAAPFIKLLTSSLSLLLPIASSSTKLLLDENVYKSIENELEFGKAFIESTVKISEKVSDFVNQDSISYLEHGEAMQAQNGILRELHSILKKKDPSFGGLVRVQNKKHEFLWVHNKFVNEY